MISSSFIDIVSAHQRMVYSIALRVTGDAGVAEEVTQDVFWELFRSAETIRNEEHVRPWLRRVSVHRATDAVRKRQRQPESGAEEWIEAYTNSPDSPLSLEAQARIDELLESLPESMRTAVILRYQEDLTPTEIADILAQPLQTVKSNLKRGLQLLRRKAAVTMKGYAV